MPKPLAYTLLAVLFAWAAAVEVRTGMSLLDPNPTRYPFTCAFYTDHVEKPRPEATHAGVLERDRLVAVEGVPYTGAAVLARAIAVRHSGDTLHVTVAPEEGTPATKTVAITLTSTERASLSELMILLVTPSCCLLLGFFVAFLRPRDPLAWLLLGMMASFSCIATADVHRWPDVWRQAGLIFHGMGVFLWPVFMCLFGIYFPERWDIDRSRPWIKWLVIAPLFAAAVANTVDSYGASENFRALQGFEKTYRPLEKFEVILMMLGIGMFFTVLGFKKGTTTAPDAKRRLSLLLTGANWGLMPSGIFFISRVFFGSYLDQKVPWLVVPAFITLFLFPATLAYVIVVHRALDVRVAIRQGLQYALLRGGLRVIMGAFVAVAIVMASRSGAKQVDRLRYTGMAVAAIMGMRKGAIALQGWIDRRFFREAVDTERVLGELSEKVRGIVETGPLIEVVARRLSESLHVSRVAVLLDGSGGYCPAFSIGYDDASVPCLPEQGAIARKLTGSGAARVYFDDPTSWVNTSTEMGDRERAPLRALDTQLLLPLLVKDRLPGIISLGPKQSEEPYSPSDVRLLESVAAQTGLALENARLTSAMASEVAQRERLNREVEIAREVQERLFPQNSPNVPRFDYCGHCRPALGVGGDYYDFLLQADGTLGIAIGDVSGKGIAAALLMASLQASLRGQTLREPGETGANLATIMQHVNRLVYDASSSNRYATFFFASYDPSTRLLTYVNAGHNPPAVIRGADTIRLEAGGAVVGLLPDFPYGEGSVVLQPGDVFLGFTDGISESMDPEDEEWGEDAMIEAARVCCTEGLTAREMVDRLIREADAFARGAKQHDDMTLVVGRVL